VIDKQIIDQISAPYVISREPVGLEPDSIANRAKGISETNSNISFQMAEVTIDRTKGQSMLTNKGPVSYDFS